MKTNTLHRLPRSSSEYLNYTFTDNVDRFESHLEGFFYEYCFQVSTIT